MFKKTLIALGLVLTTGLVHAQFYLRAGGGYALPAAQQNVGVEQRTSDGNVVSNTSEVKKASYGAGVVFNVGGGYMFSKYLGADLNISYLLGKSFSSGNYYRNDFGRDEEKTEIKSKALFFTPALVLTAGEGTKVPYGRFGVIIGSPKLEGEESSYYDLDGTFTTLAKWEERKGIAVGFQGAIGMNWGLSDNIMLNTEVNFVSLKYAPNERKLTASEVNGVSNLDQQYEYYKKTEYKDKIDYNPEPPLDQPRQALKENQPFSSISFQVGIIYVFGGISID